MNTIKALFSIYSKIQKLIAPNLKYSQYIYENVLRVHINSEVQWIDIGAGHQILPPWRLKEENILVKNCKNIVGFDYDISALKCHRSIRLKVKGDIAKLPFRNNLFDLVTANMVVEHMHNPDIQFREVYRILKPGGMFIFHTPNALGYGTILARMIPDTLKRKLTLILHDRGEEDVFKAYYRANTRRRVRNLSAKVGFKIVRIKMIVSSAITAIIPPLALLELIWIRILMIKPLRSIRTNIIVILEKPGNDIIKVK